MWWAGKEKGKSRTGKEKREGQTAIEAPIALIRLRLIEPEVKKSEEAATEARRSREAATGAKRLKEVVTGAGGPGEATIAGERGPVSLSLSTILLSLAFLAFRQAFFLSFDKHFWRIFSLFSLLFFF